MRFSETKSRILEGCSDPKARKKSIDSKIADLVSLINDSEEYVTTSSCSGRTVLFCEPSTDHLDSGHKSGKGSCKWLFVEHDKFDASLLLGSADPGEGDLILKFEPFILHVLCSTLPAAKKMLQCALASGYRNSGLVIGRSEHPVLAIRSTLMLQVPLSHGGALLVDEKYMLFLAEKCNSNFDKNDTAFERLYNNLKGMFSDAGKTDAEGASRSKTKSNRNSRDKPVHSEAGKVKENNSEQTDLCQIEDMFGDFCESALSAS